MKNPDTRWLVTDLDWQHFKLYDKFRRTSERAIRTTSTGEAPWIIIEGADRRYRSITVGKYILDLVSKRIAIDNAKAIKIAPSPVQTNNSFTILDTLNLKQSLSEEDYKRLLEKYQGRLNLLFRQGKSLGQSVILVFEGWDAAGKGGLIRRVTSALDARDYQVIPIAAPTDEERSHHYLWRFWRHLPRSGRVTIFDRSWYGRVLVERIEGFASEAEWKRAYNEIVNFEQQLHEQALCCSNFGFILILMSNCAASN